MVAAARFVHTAVGTLVIKPGFGPEMRCSGGSQGTEEPETYLVRIATAIRALVEAVGLVAVPNGQCFGRARARRFFFWQPQAPSPGAGEEAGPGELPTAADVYQALLFARLDLENAAVRAVRAVQSVGTAQASEPFVDDGLSSGDESEDDLLEELESEDDDDSELDSEENGDGSGSEESYYDTETDVEGANREEDGTRRVAPASTSAKGAAALNQANIIPPPPSYHSPP
ncbi:hypothetical protein V8E36_006568 [Tilletia maclaganii]